MGEFVASLWGVGDDSDDNLSHIKCLRWHKYCKAREKRRMKALIRRGLSNQAAGVKFSRFMYSANNVQAKGGYIVVNTASKRERSQLNCLFFLVLVLETYIATSRNYPRNNSVCLYQQRICIGGFRYDLRCLGIQWLLHVTAPRNTVITSEYYIVFCFRRMHMPQLPIGKVSSNILAVDYLCRAFAPRQCTTFLSCRINSHGR